MHFLRSCGDRSQFKKRNQVIKDSKHGQTHMNFGAKRKKTHKAVVEVEAETRENLLVFLVCFLRGKRQSIECEATTG